MNYTNEEKKLLSFLEKYRCLPIFKNDLYCSIVTFYLSQKYNFNHSKIEKMENFAKILSNFVPFSIKWRRDFLNSREIT